MADRPGLRAIADAYDHFLALVPEYRERAKAALRDPSADRIERAKALAWARSSFADAELRALAGVEVAA